MPTSLEEDGKNSSECWTTFDIEEAEKFSISLIIKKMHLACILRLSSWRGLVPKSGETEKYYTYQKVFTQINMPLEDTFVVDLQNLIKTF